MMFWLGVSAAYLVLIGVGLVLGHWLASRGRGWGRGHGTPAPVDPGGPPHAVAGAEGVARRPRGDRWGRPPPSRCPRGVAPWTAVSCGVFTWGSLYPPRG